MIKNWEINKQKYVTIYSSPDRRGPGSWNPYVQLYVYKVLDDEKKAAKGKKWTLSIRVQNPNTSGVKDYFYNTREQAILAVKKYIRNYKITTKKIKFVSPNF